MSSRLDYVAPNLQLDAFNCPNCYAFAVQRQIVLNGQTSDGLFWQELEFRVTYCARCKSPTIWHGDNLIYPAHSGAEPAHRDMPADVKRDFEEARLIVNQSPRGAAALLRLALQKLCKHLGQPGRNINEDIKALVANGLPVAIQQTLDIVRIIGNNAVHPGQLDVNDRRETAVGIFKLINFIVEKAISEPRQIAEMFSELPASALQGIRDRDGT